MAEADDDQEETVPWDGKIVDNDQQHCPSDLIWVQKGDGTLLINPDLLEGKGAAAKSRRSESPAGLPRMVNDVYVVPPLGKGVKMDVATKSFLVPARNSKGKLLGFNEGYGFPPPPPPLSQPAMGTDTVNSMQEVGLTYALRFSLEKTMTADNMVQQSELMSKVSIEGVKARDKMFYGTFPGLSQTAQQDKWGLLAPLVVKPGGAADGLGGEELAMATYHKIVGGVPLGLTGELRWYHQQIKSKLSADYRIWAALGNLKTFEIRDSGQVKIVECESTSETDIHKFVRDTNIEVAPEYEKCTLLEALVSDMDFEFEVYTHDKTKCDAYKTELDTYKASLEVYKNTKKTSGAAAAGERPKEPKLVPQPSPFGNDLRKRAAYPEDKDPYFCELEKSKDISFLQQRTKMVHQIIWREEQAIARTKSEAKMKPEQKKIKELEAEVVEQVAYIDQLEMQRDGMSEILSALLPAKTTLRQLTSHKKKMAELINEPPEPPAKRRKV